MGTRADFYIGRGPDAEWLGSVAMDGYPSGIQLHSKERDDWGGYKSTPFPTGQHLFNATTEAEFKERLEQYFVRRRDVTRPDQGWPWPWNDSRTTDYAYAFDEGQVWACCFGRAWWKASEEEPEREDTPDHLKIAFPDMAARKNVAWDKRSGLLIVSLPAPATGGQAE